MATPTPKYENLSQLGSWRVDRYLNSGGFGDVYLCERRDVTGSRTTAAIKVVDPRHPKAIEASLFLLKEYDMLKRVKSPYVAPVVDSGREKVLLGRNVVEVPWVAVEFVPGQSLFDEVKSQGVLSEAEWLDLAYDLFSAVAATHQVGLVNSDIKPENVMRSSRKSVLIDFGGANVQGIDEGNQSRVYSFGFSSPEQLSSTPTEKVSYEADLFAIGATLVFAATGVTPWDFPRPSGSNEKDGGYARRVAAHKIITTKKPRLEGLSEAQRELVQKLIDIDPRMRLSARDALLEVQSAMSDGNPRKSGEISFERVRSVAQYVRPKQRRKLKKSEASTGMERTYAGLPGENRLKDVMASRPGAAVSAEPGARAAKRLITTIILVLFVPLFGALTRLNFLEEERRVDYTSRIEVKLAAVFYSWWSFGFGGALVARRWYKRKPHKALLILGTLAPGSMAVAIATVSLAQTNAQLAGGLGQVIFFVSLMAFYAAPLIQNRFMPGASEESGQAG